MAEHINRGVVDFAVFGMQQPHAKILADANKLCFPAAKDFSRIPKLLYPKLSEAA